MKRPPLFYPILMIELVVGLILLYNVSYLAASFKQKNVKIVDRAAQAAALTLASPTIAAVAITQTQSAAAQPLALVALSPTVLSVFAPLPAEATPRAYPLTNEMVNLGRMLFYEPRLSATQDMSCNTCHLLDQYGTDGLPVSVGHDGKPVKRNSPTVYNAAFQIAQFWDGRSPTVEEQAKVPILTMGEMGMETSANVEVVLHSIPGYASLFATAFPGKSDPVTYQNMALAIGAFERRLSLPARFDQFLAGDRAQLNADEQRGLATFITLGCTTCHMGVTVGGLVYKKLGEREAFPTDDLGRFNITGQAEDKYVFKVPSLRNVAKTAPYMHDGKINTLDEMVRIMARYQLGKPVTDAQVTDIVTFLNTLTGDIPTNYIAQPKLPDNGPNTPRPKRVN